MSKLQLTEDFMWGCIILLSKISQWLKPIRVREGVGISEALADLPLKSGRNIKSRDSIRDKYFFNVLQYNNEASK